MKSVENTGLLIESADVNFLIQSEEAYDGKFAKGIVSINYAAGRDEIRRPLIVAEGFDPGIIISPENPLGLTDISTFIDEIDFSTSFELRNLLTNDFTQEYDIVYVDWLNGVDDMRRNAELLETVIEWVNTEKAISGSIEENVVLGQSMGGVIARYALREMELENEIHETRLYISQDAPHQGANVPLGLQFMARHARNEYVKAPVLLGLAEVIIPTVLNVADFYSQHILNNLGFDTSVDDPYPSPYSMLTIADMPASRQLLINYVERDYDINNTVHDAWQNELSDLGYPENSGIKNVAISNGSECGTLQEIGSGNYLFRFNGTSSPGFFNGVLRMVTDPLVAAALTDFEFLGASLLPGSSKYSYDIWAKTIPTGIDKQVYKGRIVYTKKLLFLIPIDVVLMSKDLHAPLTVLPLDNYPGGIYDVKEYLDLDNLPSFLSDRITNLENFNFIPVTSALDIGLGEINLVEEDYLKAYSGGTPPTAPKNSPFNNYITAFNPDLNSNPNQKHISFQLGNADWLAGELNSDNPIANCSFVCSAAEIQGPDSVCGSSTIYSFPSDHIEWTISDSSIASIIPNNQSVEVIPNSVGFVILEAEITDPNCGSPISITKRIGVGPVVKISLDPDVSSTTATANVTGNKLTSASFEIIESSGLATVNLVDNGNGSYTFFGRGSTNTWTKTISLTVTTDCGEITKIFTLTPPPLPPSDCNFSIQSVKLNTYAILPPPDEPCYTNLTMTTSTLNGQPKLKNNYSMKVFDLNGILRSETIENFINIESLEKGFYIIKAKVNARMLTKKIFKN